jgi:hypothetical protein
MVRLKRISCLKNWFLFPDEQPYLNTAGKTASTTLQTVDEITQLQAKLEVARSACDLRGEIRVRIRAPHAKIA